MRLGQTMSPQFLRPYWRGCKRCGRAKIGQRWDVLPLHKHTLNRCKCCEYLVTPVVCGCARDQNWIERANQTHESITFCPCTIHALVFFRKGRNWAVEQLSGRVVKQFEQLRCSCQCFGVARRKTWTWKPPRRLWKTSCRSTLKSTAHLSTVSFFFKYDIDIDRFMLQRTPVSLVTQ